MMKRMLSSNLLPACVVLLAACDKKSDAFSGSITSPQQLYSRKITSTCSRQTHFTFQLAVDDLDDASEWISLVEPTGDDEIPAVRKHIMDDGEESGDIPPKGSTVEIEYTGTLLGEKDWSTNDVVTCWLSQLQGLDHLAPKFVDNEIDASKLMDESFFTEEYCMEKLGISNKIQAKKLVMAQRRLVKQQVEYPRGTEFDSSKSRGKNYSFVLGQGKVIKAMELAVGSMKVGERSLMVCRSDYGYGSEGLRTSKGDVMVPPFATLCFEIKLVSATE